MSLGRMGRRLTFGLALLLSSAILLPASASAKGRSYSGGYHRSSGFSAGHRRSGGYSSAPGGGDGWYRSGSGSSHRGGHYTNPNTGNHYRRRR